MFKNTERAIKNVDSCMGDEGHFYNMVSETHTIFKKYKYGNNLPLP